MAATRCLSLAAIASGLRRLLAAAPMLLIAAAPLQAQQAERPRPLQSGLEFTGAEARALQQDDFANPAMLWVARGEQLWSEPAGTANKSCASCHGDAETSMKGVAATYPRLADGELLNPEGRINRCRNLRQQAEKLAYESDALLGLTAYVAIQSHGMPIAVEIDDANRAHFEAGRALYYRRQGQLNLACAHCHEKNWGRRLGAETISQGHGNDYPIYRLDWQSAGSLHRRFRGCLYGVRAEPLPQGSAEFLDLELFLAWRAQGLAIETPEVRR